MIGATDNYASAVATSTHIATTTSTATNSTHNATTSTTAATARLAASSDHRSSASFHRRRRAKLHKMSRDDIVTADRVRTRDRLTDRLTGQIRRLAIGHGGDGR